VFAATRIPILAVLIVASAGAAELFEFRNGFWQNLHHYAYQTAQQTDSRETILQPDAWRACVEFYRAQFIKKDLLFDEEMMRIKLALSNGDLKALSEPHADILRAAAQSYREGAWGMDSRRNQEWIATMRPLLTKHGAALSERLTEFYGVPWPEKPVVVDLVPYAGVNGAFTSLEPTHIVISTAEPANRGNSGFEILFHEASHGLIRPIQNMISEEGRRQNAYLPRRDLWHVFLFFTTGEIVKRELGQVYVPYGYKNGLYTGTWGAYAGALERFWIPVIDGKAEKAAAIEAIVHEVKTERPPAKK